MLNLKNRLTFNKLDLKAFIQNNLDFKEKITETHTSSMLYKIKLSVDILLILHKCVFL